MDRAELLRTHIREPKRGEVVEVRPYQLKCSKQNGQIFIKGGVQYYGDGTPVNKQLELEDAKLKLEAAEATLKAIEARINDAAKAATEGNTNEQSSTTVVHDGLRSKGKRDNS